MEKYQQKCGKTTEIQKDKEVKLKSEFSNLFDIVHANASTIITVEEDRQFLLAQREPRRPGVMTTVDITLKKKEARKR